MKFLVRSMVIAAQSMFILKLYVTAQTMALVLECIGSAGVIMWIAEG
jgi:hypothetical protein